MDRDPDFAIGRYILHWIAFAALKILLALTLTLSRGEREHPAFEILREETYQKM